jgi:hypothetical protein
LALSSSRAAVSQETPKYGGEHALRPEAADHRNQGIQRASNSNHILPIYSAVNYLNYCCPRGSVGWGQQERGRLLSLDFCTPRFEF